MLFKLKIKNIFLYFYGYLVALYSYNTINSVYEVIQFDDLKEVRYQKVIKNLIDIT